MTGYLIVALNIAKVALGLGFVIFLHELGHFLVAKWAGVKVETFSLGFGPALLRYRRGETDYILAALPLGGYVKMLGEGEGAPAGPEAAAGPVADPRAFPNKSVGARMAIISAGVVMNLILGVACFAAVYMLGTKVMPIVAGAVEAGSPAYLSGLRPGDEVVAIDGRPESDFLHFRQRVALSGQGHALQVDVRRPGVAATQTFYVEPTRRGEAETPTVGLIPSAGLTLDDPPFERLPGMAEGAGAPALKPGDVAFEAGPVAGAPEPVDSHHALRLLLSKYRDRPITLGVRRPPAEAAQGGEQPSGTGPETVKVTLPPNLLLDFGLRFEAGPIAAVAGESIALKAGFRAGDRIVKVDGRDDFDPMHLPDYCRERAGSDVTIEVARGPETFAIVAKPDDSPTWGEPSFPGEPLEVPGLGLAFPIVARARAVAAGSPAEKAGWRPGDAVAAMTLLPRPKAAKPGEAAEAIKPVEVALAGEADKGWPFAFYLVQAQPWAKVSLTKAGEKAGVEVMPRPEAGWFNPDRGLGFAATIRDLPPQPLLASLRRGSEEAYENVVGTYALIRNMFQRRLGPGGLAGIPRISLIAYQAANEGVAQLLKFLGMLSISLAVLNFLPIFPLDGGQMVFLAAEKVRGRPLPEAATNLGQTAGIIFVLVLILFVNGHDVYVLVKGWLS